MTIFFLLFGYSVFIFSISYCLGYKKAYFEGHKQGYFEGYENSSNELLDLMAKRSKEILDPIEKNG